MASSDDEAGDLEKLAGARFGDLSHAEIALLRAAPNWEPAPCGPSPNSGDPTNDPAGAGTWGRERQVRAQLIRWLCTDREAAARVDPRGIRLLGATVVGELDLSFVKVPFPLHLSRCCAADRLTFTSAEIPSLDLMGSWIHTLNAAGAKFAGSIFLNWGFTATDEVTLLATEIGGSLACGKGTFKNPPNKDRPGSGQALNAEGAKIAGSVMLHAGFVADGEVRLRGIQIGGNLACDYGTFKNPPQKDFPEAGTALDAEGAKIQGGVLLRFDFMAEGEVRVQHAQIGSNLECHGGTFRNPPQKDLPASGTALSADAVRVTGGVFLRGGFKAEGAVSLYGAQIGVILGCEGGTFKNPPQKDVPGGGTALDAAGVKVAGDVSLGGNFMAEGEVRLPGAQIGGSLDCDGGTFRNPPQKDLLESGKALNANNAAVTGNVFLRGGFNAEGEVRLLGAEIGGNLEGDGGTFTNPPQKDLPASGTALSADAVRVTGGVFLRGGFKAEGAVSLYGAQIGVILGCEGGTFKNPPQKDFPEAGTALDAEGAKIQGGVRLGFDFMAEGEVRLPGAQIGGSLDCDGGTFTNPPQKDLPASGTALSGDALRVTGGVFLRGGFKAEGAVRLLGAEIGGSLDCDRGTFTNPWQKDLLESGTALRANNATVTGNVALRGGFTAEGEVQLLGTEIGGSLECDGGSFTNPPQEDLSASGLALNAGGAKVAGDVFLSDGFSAEGEVRLLGAAIGGTLFLPGVQNRQGMTVDLINASVGSLGDSETSWPMQGNLLLDGFKYRRISEGPRDARSRLRWLDLQPEFWPGTYRQLAKVLREMGDDRGARRLLYSMEHRRRKQQNRMQAAQLWGWVPKQAAQFWGWGLKAAIGYGYYPARALGWLLALMCGGWLLFGLGYRVGSMAPTDREAYATFEQQSGLPRHYPRFSAPIYSLENSLPLVRLGQDSYWTPNPDPSSSAHAPSVGSGRVNKLAGTLAAHLPNWLLAPWLLRWFRWGQILAGWLLATLFVAGVTGIVRKE